MELNDIYKDFEIENDSFECKARLDKENILGWLKTIDAFSNTKGGILFIGVGRAKAVPYKSFYNWPPTLKLPVERGHPTTPRPAVPHIKNPQRTLPHP